MHRNRWMYLLERRPAGVHLLLTALSLAVVCLVGWADYYIDAINFFVIYSVIIMLASLFLSAWDGAAIAALICGINFFVYKKFLAYGAVINLFLNTSMDFVFFLIIAGSVAALRRSLLREQNLSRTDYLTGAANKRFFMDQLEREINRSGRTGRTFSLAYIDLDNFKKVNDTLGHSAGDRILRTAVKLFKENIRSHDTAGRIGGDEFVILMPETDSADARTVLDRIQQSFLSKMAESAFPVSLSIGIAVFNRLPESADAAFKAADSLMYQVKNSGKNRIELSEFRDESALPGEDGARACLP